MTCFLAEWPDMIPEAIISHTSYGYVHMTWGITGLDKNLNGWQTEEKYGGIYPLQSKNAIPRMEEGTFWVGGNRWENGHLDSDLISESNRPGEPMLDVGYVNVNWRDRYMWMLQSTSGSRIPMLRLSS